ncbi:PH domain-containing protein [Parvibaculum sp.]|uniref:PH domain-containing protein n=1 Tax=Parvibaculum sp. TaxID=2024848 RepID=UPI003C743145
MGYVAEIIDSDEKVIGEARIHWIYLVIAILIALIGLTVVIGPIIAIYMFLSYYLKEFVITNKRVIYKRGVISRHVDEIDIRRIEGTNLRQGLLGRMLGYGRVIVRGTGVGNINFPLIASPLEFKRLVDKTSNSAD